MVLAGGYKNLENRRWDLAIDLFKLVDFEKVGVKEGKYASEVLEVYAAYKRNRFNFKSICEGGVIPYNRLRGIAEEGGQCGASDECVQANDNRG